MDHKRRHATGGFLPYILNALAIVVCYILFSLILKTDESMLRILMMAGVALCGVSFIAHAASKRGRFNVDYLILALIVAGIVMRIGYMLYTPMKVRGHDVLGVDSVGHFGYMYGIFANGSLPDSNTFQFYHPPFQHIVQVIVVKLFSFFQVGTDINALFESSKLVPCFASCALLWVSRSLCDAMKLPRRVAAIALAILAFHPTLYILSASVNNDSLMLLFFMISVLYTIRWYYTPTMKNVLILALSIGLAMMTKLSGAMAALFTGPVFLLMLIKKLREKNISQLLKQFITFALVCVPLGLWYPIRNYILFDQPLWYVLRASEEHDIYCGMWSAVDRFLSIPLDKLFNPLYCKPGDDYNLWLYTIKCSVFGEFTFDQMPYLAIQLIATNVVVILMSLAAMLYVLLKCRNVNKFARYGLFYIWLVQMVSFIVFNIKYPFGCTMDFRYIIPTAFIGAIYIGIALNHLKKWEKSSWAGLYLPCCVMIGLFALFSTLFYTVKI